MDWSFTPVPRVFEHFESLTQIPHPSRHTKAVSDFCVRFAKEHHLEVQQDAANNVIIRKPATPGREKDPVVMLQGHLDMVPAVEEGREFDFLTDPLQLQVEGDYLRATGTTLGGDDGIAVAMSLAVLEDDTISHPPLVCVFTTDEEIGLLGASALDMSSLKADMLLNLDSEAEGILTVSCAGGATVRLALPAEPLPMSGRICRLSLSGLTGGHSGADIDKHLDNAIRVLAGILNRIFPECPEFGLVSAKGGSADNAIPSSASAEILVPEGKISLLRAAVADMNLSLFADVKQREAGALLELTETGETAAAAVPADEAVRVLSWILGLPDGVRAMNADIPGLVQTSSNQGILSWKDGTCTLTISVRSCVNEEKEELITFLRSQTGQAGGSSEVFGKYPGWPARKDSRLAGLCCRVWKELTGEEMKVEAIHAGLECGLFADGIPGLDCVSLGPDMKDIHTPRERLSISSTGRVWEFVVRMLDEIRAE